MAELTHDLDHTWSFVEGGDEAMHELRALGVSSGQSVQEIYVDKGFQAASEALEKGHKRKRDHETMPVLPVPVAVVVATLGSCLEVEAENAKQRLEQVNPQDPRIALLNGLKVKLQTRNLKCHKSSQQLGTISEIDPVSAVHERLHEEDCQDGIPRHRHCPSRHQSPRSSHHGAPAQHMPNCGVCGRGQRRHLRAEGPRPSPGEGAPPPAGNL